MIGDDAVEKDAEMRVANRFQMRGQLAPHLVDGPRRREHAVFFAEALQAVLIRVDAADMRDNQLLLTLKRRRARFDAHELARLELLFEAFDVVKELGGYLAASRPAA